MAAKQAPQNNLHRLYKEFIAGKPVPREWIDTPHSFELSKALSAISKEIFDRFIWYIRGVKADEVRVYSTSDIDKSVGLIWSLRPKSIYLTLVDPDTGQYEHLFRNIDGLIREDVVEKLSINCASKPKPIRSIHMLFSGISGSKSLKEIRWSDILMDEWAMCFLALLRCRSLQIIDIRAYGSETADETADDLEKAVTQAEMINYIRWILMKHGLKELWFHRKMSFPEMSYDDLMHASEYVNPDLEFISLHFENARYGVWKSLKKSVPQRKAFWELAKASYSPQSTWAGAPVYHRDIMEKLKEMCIPPVIAHTTSNEE